MFFTPVKKEDLVPAQDNSGSKCHVKPDRPRAIIQAFDLTNVGAPSPTSANTSFSVSLFLCFSHSFFVFLSSAAQYQALMPPPVGEGNPPTHTPTWQSHWRYKKYCSLESPHRSPPPGVCGCGGEGWGGGKGGHVDKLGHLAFVV